MTLSILNFTSNGKANIFEYSSGAFVSRIIVSSGGIFVTEIWVEQVDRSARIMKFKNINDAVGFVNLNFENYKKSLNNKQHGNV